MKQPCYNPFNVKIIACGALLAVAYSWYRIGNFDFFPMPDWFVSEPAPVSARLQAIQTAIDKPISESSDQRDRPIHSAPIHRAPIHRAPIHSAPIHRASSAKTGSPSSSLGAKQPEQKAVSWTEFQEIAPFSTFDDPAQLDDGTRAANTPPRATPTPLFLR
jgi:hypothetical protein